MSIFVAAIIGGLIGFGGINLMAYMAKSADNPYDQRDFTTSDDVLGKVATWAAASGYTLKSDDGTRRVYAKGMNVLTAPMCLEVHRNGDRYTTRSYVHVNGLILKGDMALTHPGVLAKLPRVNARKAQNLLLTDLGQPLLA